MIEGSNVSMQCDYATHIKNSDNMKRWIFNLTALASFFLVVLFSVGWLFGSVRPSDLITHNLDSVRSYHIDLLDRGIYLGLVNLPFPPGKSAGLLYNQPDNTVTVMLDERYVTTPKDLKMSVVGLELGNWSSNVKSEPQNGTGSGYFIQIPYWMAIGLMGMCPAIWIFQAYQGRPRFPIGYCLLCGYDLRASIHRCPECGEAFIPEPEVLAMAA
jgi:hypothetical protein